METWDLLQQSEHLYMYGILTLRYQLQTPSQCTWFIKIMLIKLILEARKANVDSEITHHLVCVCLLCQSVPRREKYQPPNRIV